jgi:hypothetical protein
MRAQELYDARQEFEFCSGDELRQFFMTDAGFRDSDPDPAPKGRRWVNEENGIRFIVQHMKRMMNNAPRCYKKVLSEMKEYIEDPIAPCRTQALVEVVLYRLRPFV